MLRLFVFAAVTGVFFSVLVVVFVWRWQERLVWQPPAVFPRSGAADARRVDYAAEDGQPLLGWLVTPAHSGRGGTRAPGVVIAFHGIAEVAAHRLEWGRELARRTGWAVLLAEYRGYAGLPGAVTYEGARLDARAAHRWAHGALGVSTKDVAVFGVSLGSAVASELAAEVRARALVLQSPFTSARDMARVIGTWPVAVAWPLIGRIGFDTRARVATLDAPVWVVHGTADAVIPAWMGRAVHAAAQRAGGLLVIPGAGHNDLEMVGGEQYWRFLEAALGETAGHSLPAGLRHLPEDRASPIAPDETSGDTP